MTSTRRVPAGGAERGSAAVAHTRFRHGAVEDIDTGSRAVRLAAGSAPAQWIPYDHLILATGSVPHFLDLPGVEQHARTLKDLSDATQLRNQVIGLLERADHLEPDPQQRRRLLTFVVAGGGFAGAETIAELFDLVHGVLHYFPGIAPDEPRFVLFGNSGSFHRIAPSSRTVASASTPRSVAHPARDSLTSPLRRGSRPGATVPGHRRGARRREGPPWTLTTTRAPSAGG